MLVFPCRMRTLGLSLVSAGLGPLFSAPNVQNMVIFIFLMLEIGLRSQPGTPVVSGKNLIEITVSPNMVGIQSQLASPFTTSPRRIMGLTSFASLDGVTKRLRGSKGLRMIQLGKMMTRGIDSCQYWYKM